mmetsp:Transcript_18096/g.33702  ORF Transcript_18096/g.33702 Transcript_18096/m.33702 type:complete len:186 (-) Transcript_18096:195-752(-)
MSGSGEAEAGFQGVCKSSEEWNFRDCTIAAAGPAGERIAFEGCANDAEVRFPGDGGGEEEEATDTGAALEKEATDTCAALEMEATDTGADPEKEVTDTGASLVEKTASLDASSVYASHGRSTRDEHQTLTEGALQPPTTASSWPVAADPVPSTSHLPVLPSTFDTSDTSWVSGPQRQIFRCRRHL